MLFWWSMLKPENNIFHDMLNYCSQHTAKYFDIVCTSTKIDIYRKMSYWDFFLQWLLYKLHNYFNTYMRVQIWSHTHWTHTYISSLMYMQVCRVTWISFILMSTFVEALNLSWWTLFTAGSSGHTANLSLWLIMTHFGASIHRF